MNESLQYCVYILKGTSGRHYIGCTSNLEQRLQQHRQGNTHTTRRLGGDLQLIISRAYADFQTASKVERKLKNWKNPARAIAFLDKYV